MLPLEMAGLAASPRTDLGSSYLVFSLELSTNTAGKLLSRKGRTGNLPDRFHGPLHLPINLHKYSRRRPENFSGEPADHRKRSCLHIPLPDPLERLTERLINWPGPALPALKFHGER